MARTVQLQPIIAGDESVLLAFVQKYYAEDHLVYNPKVEAAVLELIEHPEWGRHYRILSDNVTVGYLGLTYAFDHEVGGRFGTITDFYIEPEHRAHGIGTVALQETIKLAKSLGLREIGLVVLDHNDQVRPLYARHGFRPDTDRGWMWLNLDQN